MAPGIEPLQAGSSTRAQMAEGLVGPERLRAIRPKDNAPTPHVSEMLRNSSPDKHPMSLSNKQHIRQRALEQSSLGTAVIVRAILEAHVPGAITERRMRG